jgi:DNA-binding response OmpR family regulator
MLTKITSTIEVKMEMIMPSSLIPLNNVLLLEDNSEIRSTVRLHLEVLGFVVYDTPSPVEAQEVFEQHDFSLAILHLSHAPLRSLELCRIIRAASTVPIIMFTQRGEVINEEMVMSAGADDYASIPVDLKILTSRVSQQIKRGQTQRAPRANILLWGSLQMDLSDHSFKIDEKHVPLTNMEYQFLQLLMENPKRVFSRNQILEAIGVTKGIGTDHVVDSHASRIRAKIREHGGPEVISVIRSVGFRLVDPSPGEVATITIEPSGA